MTPPALPHGRSCWQMAGICISISELPSSCAPRGWWGAQVTLLLRGCLVSLLWASLLCCACQRLFWLLAVFDFPWHTARIAWDNASYWSLPSAPRNLILLLDLLALILGIIPTWLCLFLSKDCGTLWIIKPLFACWTCMGKGQKLFCVTVDTPLFLRGTKVVLVYHRQNECSGTYKEKNQTTKQQANEAREVIFNYLEI